MVDMAVFFVVMCYIYSDRKFYEYKHVHQNQTTHPNRVLHITGWALSSCLVNLDMSLH